MQIPRPSEDVKTLFRSVIPDAPGVIVKPMFGNLGAFVNGNMFAGLFGDAIGVRVLNDQVRAELAEIDGVGPFGPAERPMGGYLALPTTWSERPELLAQWVERALAEVSELPEKKPKPRRSSAS
ncbi:MAG: TfoX family protein [Microbacteriaceae bacterium]|nr:MAG: TfoX family protein [Microbacteriaceae bacterium]